MLCVLLSDRLGALSEDDVDGVTRRVRDFGVDGEGESPVAVDESNDERVALPPDRVRRGDGLNVRERVEVGLLDPDAVEDGVPLGMWLSVAVGDGDLLCEAPDVVDSVGLDVGDCVTELELDVVPVFGETETIIDVDVDWENEFVRLADSDCVDVRLRTRVSDALSEGLREIVAVGV